MKILKENPKFINKKIVYNDFFKQKDQKKILLEEQNYKYSYHLIITFKNNLQYKETIKKIYNSNNKLIEKFYSWNCGTRKYFKNKNKNRHKKKNHIHSILFSNTLLNLDLISKNLNIDISDLDIRLVETYTCVKDILKYIFDGHHIFKAKCFIKKIRRKVFNSFKTILKKLSVSSDNDFIYRSVGVVMKT